MNPKRIACLALLLLASTALADDFWKAKSWKEWDEKDIRKVLNDSPWSRPVTIMVAALSRQDSAGVGGIPAPNISGPSTGSSGPAGNSRGGGGGSAGDSPQTTYLVRWVSSTTVRRALARAAVIRGGAKELEVEKVLAQVPEDFEIRIFGQDMQPFAKTDEIVLRGKTWIRPKSSKTKIAPSRVEIQRTGDGKGIQYIVFYFSKKTDSGEAVIPAGEKKVEFVCGAGIAIQTDFDLQKMALKDGPDL